MRLHQVAASDRLRASALICAEVVWEGMPSARGAQIDIYCSKEHANEATAARPKQLHARLPDSRRCASRRRRHENLTQAYGTPLRSPTTLQ